MKHGPTLTLAMLLFAGDVRAQVPPSARPLPESACPDSVARRDCPLADVSLIQMLATPERFDGRHVRVVGFVHIEFEGNAVYLHREDFEAGLLRNAIWVDFRPGALSAARPINDRYVLLEGIFDAQHHGHMGMFGGALRDISSADPWPSRADIKHFKVLQRRVP